jgi:hypothetical protein
MNRNIVLKKAGIVEEKTKNGKTIQIHLTIAINKGKLYPYNSVKRGWVKQPDMMKFTIGED